MDRSFVLGKIGWLDLLLLLFLVLLLVIFVVVLIFLGFYISFLGFRLINSFLMVFKMTKLFELQTFLQIADNVSDGPKRKPIKICYFNS